MTSESFHEVVVFPTGPELLRRLPRLLAGLPCLGIGIAMMVRARLGLSPYDVLHQGLARRTGLSIGVVIILVGFVVLLAWIPLRQRFGVGTLINTLTVGLLADAALAVIEPPATLAPRVALLVGGVIITALGIGLYIGAGLGPGPRDGLMTGIAARGYRLWVVRTALELVALTIGWTLGGDIGVGTLLFALSIGPLGHVSLTRLHLGSPGEPPPDLGPGTAAD